MDDDISKFLRAQSMRRYYSLYSKSYNIFFTKTFFLLVVIARHYSSLVVQVHPSSNLATFSPKHVKSRRLVKKQVPVLTTSSEITFFFKETSSV